VITKTPRKLYFAKGSDVPNCNLPVLLFHSILSANRGKKANRFRQVFRENGWTGIWTDTIFDCTHFHSNAHEVLAIAEGKVTVRLGGDSGRLFRLRAGDMLVLPAGVAHRRVGADDELKGSALIHRDSRTSICCAY